MTKIARLLNYVLRAETILTELPDDELLSGRVVFPNAPGGNSYGNETKT